MLVKGGGGRGAEEGLCVSPWFLEDSSSDVLSVSPAHISHACVRFPLCLPSRMCAPRDTCQPLRLPRVFVCCAQADEIEAREAAAAARRDKQQDKQQRREDAERKRRASHKQVRWAAGRGRDQGRRLGRCDCVCWAEAARRPVELCRCEKQVAEVYR